MNPMSQRDTIVEEITIKGSAERIFEALTDPSQRVKWWVPKDGFRSRTWNLTYAWAGSG